LLAAIDRHLITVRSELSRDRGAIRRVNELAFAGPLEADIVDALRHSDAWLPELSLVAEDDSGIVGHALFSLVRLDSGPELLSLGPMAVLPDRQRAGVGTALVRRGLELARGTEYPLVVVLGHPAYYPRFGFRPARRCGIETPYEAPDEAWMALPLPGYDESVRGTVLYPSAWERV
jgi:putative acetyltransferase